jgi:hypothetical protein
VSYVDEKKVRLLRKARDQANHFIEKADDALRSGQGPLNGEMYRPYYAAAKRASMDLTRALADVRRNPYS